MHNEKNVAEAIWNTCFDIKDKTKDNVKARQDIELLCDRPSLHLYKRNGKWQRPRAPYCIDKDDKIKILNWFQELKFPDGVRSEKYESKRAGLATTNSGVCVTCTDDNGNALEYFGVIEDIIKISWEGREQLDLVLFYCRWFDPTSRGVKRTENLGLVEVKHSSRLQNFEPFVLASQVTQVYYLSYASDDPSLKDWWVVYHVAPRDRLPPIDINNDSIETEGPTNDISFFQEDGLEGTFVIDLGDIELIDTLASDEITDPKELEQLEKQTVAPEQEEILESDEEGDEDDAESYDEDCYEEEDF
ncbi:uncharacterized protein [Miscanthus floridulus]|uniref:uncharacterized protein n=1 Tax=Miscanthus floridulus TaxID=154761 RepID=UPI00345A4577